ncbi:MAG: hypothetical protein DRP01_02365 [Archaeoglobales archaeon]|nr:MAG: hypothetical protein DRP01_02365 [Archaeoglobales archaeon]
MKSTTNGKLKPITVLIIVGLVVVGSLFGLYLIFLTTSTAPSTPSTDIEEYQRKIAKLEDKIKELQSDLDRKEDTIRKLKARLREKEDTIEELEGTIDELRDTIDELEDQLKEKDQEIARLKNEIERLESKIDLLEKLVPKYVKGEWNVIATFKGVGTKDTPLFSVPSSELRVRWKVTRGTYPVFSIWLYSEEGELICTWSGLELEKTGETYAHNLEPGYYYLRIWAANIRKYEVTVEVWIPKE